MGMGSPKTADEADDSCRHESEREVVMRLLMKAVLSVFLLGAVANESDAGKFFGRAMRREHRQPFQQVKHPSSSRRDHDQRMGIGGPVAGSRAYREPAFDLV